MKLFLISLTVLALAFPVWTHQSWTHQSSTHQDEDHLMHPLFNFRGRLRKRAMPMIAFDPTKTEESGDYWSNIGQELLKTQLKKNILNTNKAKKVIMFLGDGMSIPTLAAGRVYMGGEEKQFSFEQFDYSGLSKTYCANTQVADSACTATAYLGGVKANYGTIGVTAAVDINDCKGQNNTQNHVQSIAEWAQLKGMSTGVITTTSITHASPAGVYGHTANRDWENDDEIRKSGGNPEDCEDIAKQLVYGKVGSKLNVVFGGGRENFLPKWKKDVSGGEGKRTDNINLIEQWKIIQTQKNHTKMYVESRDELLNLPSNLDNVLGLFATSHLPFHLDSNEKIDPSLTEMVSKALDILEKQHQQHGKGYFLFVEGGRIDHGHHYTQAIKALDETIEFNKAVELTKSRTREEETLIVVTADHSHTMSMSGYASRKNDIFGVINGQIADDKLPYATLSYANGPGYARNIQSPEGGGKRKNLLEINMRDKDYKFPTTVPLEYETHGGDDVAVFASGPYSHLFTGVYEQNFIPHAIGYAACIGNGSKSPSCY